MKESHSSASVPSYSLSEIHRHRPESSQRRAASQAHQIRRDSWLRSSVTWLSPVDTLMDTRRGLTPDRLQFLELLHRLHSFQPGWSPMPSVIMLISANSLLTALSYLSTARRIIINLLSYSLCKKANKCISQIVQQAISSHHTLNPCLIAVKMSQELQ